MKGEFWYSTHLYNTIKGPREAKNVVLLVVLGKKITFALHATSV